MDALTQLYSNGALLVLWGALLFHLILPIPRSANPLTLWHKFAEQLANKVNNNQSFSQSIVSGTLALMLMLIPCLIVLIALIPLVWQPALFDLALMLIALDWRSNESLAKQLTLAMSNANKEKSRKLLQPYLNRDTSTLSLLGVGKAGAETLILGFGRNVIAVLFWYAIAGGIGAIMYRLTLELARAWSPTRKQFTPFGKPAQQLVAALDFIPLTLFTLMVCVGKHTSKAMMGIKTQASSWGQIGTGWLLCAVGHKLELALGGPAIYDGQRRERAKIGGRIAPAAIHLAQIQSLLVWRIFAWIILQSLIMGLIYQGL